MKQYKQIVLSMETYEELKKLKEKGVSFDGVVWRIIQLYKKIVLETV